MPDLLTAAEAAALLHMHVKHVRLLARRGQLPAIRHGRRWVFRRTELMRGRRPRGVLDADAMIDVGARNQLVGRVRSVVCDGLMAEVTMKIAPQELVALITRRSADRLGLAPRAEAFAIVKSTEVMVGIQPAGRPQQRGRRRPMA
jgi:molybdopterin-binding protein